MRAGTHKPAEAMHQIADNADGWIQEGTLLYRLTDERKPKNRDEINVLMADGSRTEEARTRRAGELLDAIRLARSADAKAEETISALHARIAELEAICDEQQAGIESLRAEIAAAPQAAQVIKANCYSDDNGDYWRDCPDDWDFVDGLKVGYTYELQASIRSWSETFRVTKAPDETSDDYEVELVSTDAPIAATNPPAQWMDAGAFEQSMSDWAHGDAQDAERYRWLRKSPNPACDIALAKHFVGGRGQDFDALIDAAIAAQAKQGEKP